MINDILTGWNRTIRVTLDDKDKVIKYTVHLYKRINESWYDEIRYDSHDNNKETPHLHIKTQTPFKAIRRIDDITDELSKIIGKVLPEIKNIQDGKKNNN